VFDQALAGGGAKSINFQVQQQRCCHIAILSRSKWLLNLLMSLRLDLPVSHDVPHWLSLSQDLAADLAQITFDYPFSIPPYFALIIRAIGVLEGIALVGNPGVRPTPGTFCLTGSLPGYAVMRIKKVCACSDDVLRL